jgi:preprotein translocase subunit YajC
MTLCLSSASHCLNFPRENYLCAPCRFLAGGVFQKKAVSFPIAAHIPIHESIIRMYYTLLQAPAGNPLLGMLFPFLIVIVFYFFLIRPQIKKQKEQQKFVESLKDGMEVVTNSGIIGRITKIDGPIVRLMVDEKTFIRVVKSSIQGEYKA